MATAAIYIGGPLYSDPNAIADLKDSGFTTVEAWALHVSDTGDFSFNDTPIVQNAEYVGDPGWPAALAGLKQGGGVTELYFSIGGWGVADFANIQQLIEQQGSGPSSILHRNFAALQSAIPVIDGIDFDDEDNYDQNTIVTLG